MAKKVFMIHGWEGTPDANWFPWIKQLLEEKNFEVTVPLMPETEAPKIEAWVNKLKEVANNLDEETYFIAHSIGCQAVLRFLETLNNVKVAKVFLVTPFVKLTEETYEEDGEESRQIAKPWIETPLNWNKIKSHCDNFIAIFSDDDPYVELTENSEVFKQNLNAKLITKHQREHFTGKEEPELWEEISKNL